MAPSALETGNRCRPLPEFWHRAARLAWEFPIDALLYQYFRIGTFNPGFWIISLLFVVVVTTVIELSIVKWLCRIELNRDESQFC
jgi:hypothetical protein